ncbi:MAG: phosphate ABC transporter permease subunit PstC [Thermosulfidibacteraceae bacterium]|jgi:phosphate transport system permease protein
MVEETILETKERKKAEKLEVVFKAIFGFSAITVGLIIPTVVFIVLLAESKLIIEKKGLIKFLLSQKWDPVSDEFGALPMIVGTLISTFISMLLATPIAIGISIFVVELAPRWLKEIIRQAIDLLGIIPSVIYGMWGFLVLAPFMATKVEPFIQRALINIPILNELTSGTSTGIDVLTTSLVLSIMIIPFMSSIVREAFEMVNPLVKESAYALGATKWEVITTVVIRSSIPGIAGGFIISLGRAIGETMAVAFLAGNRPEIPRSLLEPFTTITVALANQFTEADTELYLSALYALALILFITSFIMLLTAKIILYRLSRNGQI